MDRQTGGQTMTKRHMDMQTNTPEYYLESAEAGIHQSSYNRQMDRYLDRMIV